jgi:N-formylglutamate deformylase
MTRLPFLVSLPHGGLDVPPEVEGLCRLSPWEIERDGDEGANAIYRGLEDQVEGFVSTHVARAIVDLNRAEDDRGKDGVVKTHTCWDVPVYDSFPDETTIRTLLERYHRPYHSRLLEHVATGAYRVGLDCHTMAAEGPPVGPDCGARRPLVCLSNADRTCPADWLETLADCFRQAFDSDDVLINEPFRGGHIIRRHADALPWIQLELSRTSALSNASKAACVSKALVDWWIRFSARIARVGPRGVA